MAGAHRSAEIKAFRKKPVQLAAVAAQRRGGTASCSTESVSTYSTGKPTGLEPMVCPILIISP